MGGRIYTVSYDTHCCVLKLSTPIMIFKNVNDFLHRIPCPMVSFLQQIESKPQFGKIWLFLLPVSPLSPTATTRLDGDKIPEEKKKVSLDSNPKLFVALKQKDLS